MLVTHSHRMLLSLGQRSGYRPVCVYVCLCARGCTHVKCGHGERAARCIPESETFTLHAVETSNRRALAQPGAEWPGQRQAVLVCAALNTGPPIATARPPFDMPRYKHSASGGAGKADRSVPDFACRPDHHAPWVGLDLFQLTRHVSSASPRWAASSPPLRIASSNHSLS